LIKLIDFSHERVNRSMSIVWPAYLCNKPNHRQGWNTGSAFQLGWFT